LYFIFLWFYYKFTYFYAFILYKPLFKSKIYIKFYKTGLLKNFIPSSIFSEQQLFVVPETSNSQLPGSGKNLKQLLVLYKKEEKPELLKELLSKILKAAQFDIEQDVRLVELSSDELFSFTALQSKEVNKQVIILGLTPSQLGLHFTFEKYIPLHHINCDFLVADSLAMINENRQLKAQLWNALKVLFAIP